MRTHVTLTSNQAAAFRAGAFSQAAALLNELPPDEALRQWMDLFGNWLATKRGMLGTLLAGADPDGKYANSRQQVLAAIHELLHAGRASGTVRDDVDGEDLVASLVGIFTVAGDPAHQAQASRLLDLLMDGLWASGSKRSAR